MWVGFSVAMPLVHDVINRISELKAVFALWPWFRSRSCARGGLICALKVTLK
jgi:hypothetical protein